MMRWLLFGATNIAVLFVVSIVMRLLGVDQMMAGSGQNMTGLLIYAAVFGFVGSFISLAMSKSAAIRSTGAQVIEEPTNETERWLVETVRQQAEKAGVGMPQVAIFPSSSPNAFATGMKRNDALVAVSAGLLQSMTRDEVEAVLAHEMAHVANGDMVTMALIQGVLNTFVIVLSRLVGQIIDGFLSRGESRGGGVGYFVSVMVLQVLFGFVAQMIAAWFSRYREFRADEGGADYASRDKMIAALKRLQQGQPEELPEQMAAFGIAGGSVQKLFSTHPPLEVRIAALQEQ